MEKAIDEVVQPTKLLIKDLIDRWSAWWKIFDYLS